MGGSKWSEEDKVLLKTLIERGNSYLECAKVLNRSNSSISKQARVQGLRKRKNIPPEELKKYPRFSVMWTEEDISYLATHYENTPPEELVTHLQRSPGAIYGQMGSLGLLKKFPRSERFKKNLKWFREHLAWYIIKKETAELEKPPVQEKPLIRVGQAPLIKEPDKAKLPETPQPPKPTSNLIVNAAMEAIRKEIETAADTLIRVERNLLIHEGYLKGEQEIGNQLLKGVWGIYKAVWQTENHLQELLKIQKETLELFRSKLAGGKGGSPTTK